MTDAAGYDVSVVVVSFNSGAVLPGLLDSLPAGMEGLRWHLVVADNASGDGSADVVRAECRDATIVEMGRNAGYAAGINAAVAAAPRSTAYLILNPDVRLHRGCARILLGALSVEGCGIAVPRLLDARGELIYSLRREPSLVRALADTFLGADRAGRIGRLGEVVTDKRAYALATRPDWAEGSTQLMSRHCWQACGPWAEDFFLYSEEADFDLRARDAGLGICYVPTATATHLEGGSATSPRLWALLAVNRVKLFRRRHGLAASALFWAATVAREASRAALGKQTSRAALSALLSPRRMTERPGPHSISGAA